MASWIARWLMDVKRGGLGKRRDARARRLQKLGRRAILLERLEPRVVLNAAPIGKDDASYYTAEDTDLTIGASDTTLLDNDWDAEGSSLTATIVDNPANGTVSNFSGTAGTFTYSPDLSFTGVDSSLMTSVMGRMIVIW